MSKSPTIIEPDGDAHGEWLPNPHAGEMLALEFMQPLGLSADELAEKIEVSETTLRDTIAGTARMSGDLDLRLAQYFRMSPGFFLGLQSDYEIVEAKRALNGALDRIVPRAA
jgi:addiction module HigA family antidote